MTKNMNTFLSKIHYSTLLLLGIVLVLGAVGCQAGSTPITDTQTPEQEETEVAQQPEPTAVETDTEGEGEVVETDEVNQCLVCHTDQQALKDTANPVVDLESESSGEG